MNIPLILFLIGLAFASIAYVADDTMARKFTLGSDRIVPFWVDALGASGTLLMCVGICYFLMGA